MIIGSGYFHFVAELAAMLCWYIKHNNEELGPYSLEELSLVVSPEDQIWTIGLPDWIQARLVPELEPVFALQNKGKIIEEEKTMKPFGEMIRDAWRKLWWGDNRRRI